MTTFLDKIADEVRNTVHGIVGYLFRVTPVGSSYIYQSYTNDVDILVDISGSTMFKSLIENLIKEGGWALGGSFGEIDINELETICKDSFVSLKNKVVIDRNDYVVNIIFVTSSADYDAFSKAADICRMLHERHKIILDKNSRVDLHDMLRKNMSFEQLKETKGNIL